MDDLEQAVTYLFSPRTTIHSDYERAAAIEYIEACGSGVCRAILITFLTEQNLRWHWSYRRALRALLTMNPVEGLLALWNAVKRGDIFSGPVITESIGKMDAPEAAPLLLEMLKEDNAFLANGAVHALATIGLPVVPQLIEACAVDHISAGRALSALLLIGKPVLAELRVRRKTATPSQRPLLNRITLRMRDSAVLPDLREILLKDVHWDVLMALRHFEAQAIPILEEALHVFARQPEKQFACHMIIETLEQLQMTKADKVIETYHRVWGNSLQAPTG